MNPEEWIEVDSLDWGVQVRVRKNSSDGSTQLQVLRDDPKRVQSDVRIAAGRWKVLTGSRVRLRLDGGDWTLVDGIESRATDHGGGQMAARTRLYPDGDVELQVIKIRQNGPVKILASLRLSRGRWKQLTGQAPVVTNPEGPP